MGRGREERTLSSNFERERGVDEWVGWDIDRESEWMSGLGGIEIEGGWGWVEIERRVDGWMDRLDGKKETKSDRRGMVQDGQINTRANRQDTL